MALFVSGSRTCNAPVELREQLAVDEEPSCASSSATSPRRASCARRSSSRPATASRCTRSPTCPVKARATMFRRLCRHRGVEPASVEEAPLHLRRRRRRAPRLPRGVEPRFDGDRRAADPRPGEGRLRARPVARSGRARCCHCAVHAGVRRRQEGADRDRDRPARGVRVASPRSSWPRRSSAGCRASAVLLVGAGKMSELAARHLVEQGVFPVYVTNRTWARAQEMARALAGTAVPFDELPTALAAVDIVISVDRGGGAGDPPRGGPARHARAPRYGRCSSSTSPSRATSRAPSTRSTTCTATTSTT